ncbi:MAG: hypothetical protein E6Q24_15235 [Chitinophagaceae bacterium]|nr:MAG: hypothetical protein E6Q24_15235 [Chitinophagaceae bacterium]
MRHKIITSVFVLLLMQGTLLAQSGDTAALYNNCLDSLQSLIQEKGTTSFKKAVFLTENVYMGNQMDYEKFDTHISQLAGIARVWMRANPLQDYSYRDSINFHKNFSIFKLLKDTVFLQGPDGNKYQLLPYTYDFTDFFGRSDWGYMFVSKLLATRKGNCHSLPYLYKILADELEATCWLGLAPNHIYIKNRCRKMGWYNTELTSGTFPIDAWITASGYIPLQAIQNGIYMDTLSNQQAIALCVLDLAKGYEFQTRNYEDGFILKCCNLVLQYHPVNAQAMLLKAETLKRVYEKQQKGNTADIASTFKEMENLYVKLFELGYREMPEQMYIDWLRSVTDEGKKYNNDQLKPSIKPKVNSKL